MKINLTIRQQLLSQRNLLKKPQVKTLSKVIYSQILSHFDFVQFANIASYHALGSEVDLSRLYQQTNNVYLPVIQTNNTMQFSLFESIGNLTKNKYGILEPDNLKTIEAEELELCFLPLVGFKRNGTRLGMGGGYYDRYFELNKFKQKPTILVGIAFDFQENDTIQTQSWDIPMDIIITNKEVIDCEQAR